MPHLLLDMFPVPIYLNILPHIVSINITHSMSRVQLSKAPLRKDLSGLPHLTPTRLIGITVCLQHANLPMSNASDVAKWAIFSATAATLPNLHVI